MSTDVCMHVLGTRCCRVALLWVHCREHTAAYFLVDFAAYCGQDSDGAQALVCLLDLTVNQHGLASIVVQRCVDDAAYSQVLKFDARKTRD